LLQHPHALTDPFHTIFGASIACPFVDDLLLNELQDFVLNETCHGWNEICRGPKLAGPAINSCRCKLGRGFSSRMKIAVLVDWYETSRGGNQFLHMQPVAMVADGQSTLRKLILHP